MTTYGSSTSGTTCSRKAGQAVDVLRRVAGPELEVHHVAAELSGRSDVGGQPLDASLQPVHADVVGRVAEDVAPGVM